MHTLGPGGGVVFTKLKIYSFVARPPKSRNLKSKTPAGVFLFWSVRARKPSETLGNPRKPSQKCPGNPAETPWGCMENMCARTHFGSRLRFAASLAPEEIWFALGHASGPCQGKRQSKGESQSEGSVAESSEVVAALGHPPTSERASCRAGAGCPCALASPAAIMQI